jgi:putative ABC transport system permease protein
MIFIEVFKLSLLALKTNKVRAFLTMLGIIIGVTAVILLISLGTGLQNYINNQFESIGTNLLYVLPGQVGQEGQGLSSGAPNFAGSKLTVDDARKLAKKGGSITATSASIELPASIKYGNQSKYSRIHGVMENFTQLINLNVAEGRTLNKSDVDNQSKVAVLGPEIKNKLFANQNPIGKKILVGDVRYEVIGINEVKGGGGMGASMDDLVFVPITTVQEQFNQDNVQTIIIKVNSKENIEEAKTVTKRYFKYRLKEDEFSVVDQASLVTTINSIISVLTTALGGIAAISLLVGGIGIMNIMLVSVTERTKEIGLRKAVGARSRDILWQFLIEAVILCLVGGLIGILLGILGCAVAQRFIPASIPLWSVILAFSFSATVGIVFGVAPAYKASQLDPINALRYE